MTVMLVSLYFMELLNSPQSLIINIGLIDFLKICNLAFISKGSYEQIPYSMLFDKLLKKKFK